MKECYQPLFTPWKIGGVEIKNRIVLCPMGGTSLFGWMEPNHFDKEAAGFFLERARNHVGLIIPGIAPIRDTLGGRWLYQNKKMFRELKVFMDEIHATGAKLFVQLTAGMGRSWGISDEVMHIHKNPLLKVLAKPILDTDYQMMSPSPLPSRWAEGVTCPEITVEQIEEIVAAFAKTAALCRQAGVDGVEVHAVHEGYLLDQFAMKYTNRRTDRYGGSLENRLRFATDIVRAIKTACGADYPVSIRYSAVSKVKDFCYGALPGEEYEEIGRDMEESRQAARLLQEAGYDMLNADNGTYDSWYWAHPPMYMPQNCNLEDVAAIRQVVDIPVVCAGRMEPDTAAQAIREGRIDALGVARQFLADGAWITKLMEERMEDIRPCICCHNGCFNLSHYKGHANAQSLPDTRGMARCALEPRTMQSRKYRITPAAKTKRVAVIGGGIGGMESALVCAQRGHQVTLYEKTDRLGGVFRAAAAPSFKEKDRQLLAWYAREMTKYPNLTVRLNTQVGDVAELQADEVVVATGAVPVRLPVPGAEKGVEAVDYLLGNKTAGERVVIVGGGLTGCEIAYDLYLQGKEPLIVEQKNDLIAVAGVCLANASYLRDFFRTKKVPVYLESTVAEVGENGVTIKDKNGRCETIEADSVILSVGYRPAPLTERGGHVHLVGDAHKVGNLRTVIWRAWDVCMKL
ncbi:MAG TPA: FAD-dependent oxidoreductase [Candidatus Galloscillospira stercoripullorum]|nr:FAD-dependent oxidoreductase [Candidatus Galloscillospira stercoripullorum]